MQSGYFLAVVQLGSMTCLQGMCIGLVLSRNTSGRQSPLMSIYSWRIPGCVTMKLQYYRHARSTCQAAAMMLSVVP